MRSPVSTGRPATIGAPAGGADGTCRIGVDVRALGGQNAHRWRLLIVADVLRRYLDTVAHRRVLLAVIGPDVTPGVLVDAWALLPPTGSVKSPGEADTILGGAPTLVIEPAPPRSAGRQEAGPPVLQVAAAWPPSHRDDAFDGALREYEPAALRLSLLRFPYTCPADLSMARLHRAAETIQRWRYKVAMWHDMPPAPGIPEIVNDANLALRSRLDTAAVLQQLHRLEMDPSIASGSKFASFAQLDRVLGLDLCRLVNKLLR